MIVFLLLVKLQLIIVVNLLIILCIYCLIRSGNLLGNHVVSLLPLLVLSIRGFTHLSHRNAFYIRWDSLMTRLLQLLLMVSQR